MEQTLGKRIAMHRKSLGLTQDQLAEQLGITAQAVSKWENDQSCPDIATLPKLAKIFGITTDALLEGSADAPVFTGEVVTGQEEKEPEGIHIQKGNWNFTWESGRKGSLFFALLVLAVGIQLLAVRLSPLYDLSFWQILWPTSLIVYGIYELTKRLSFTGMGLLLFGGYFLLNYWGVLPFQLGGDLVWPVIIVLFGLSLLVDALGKPRKPRFRFHHNGKDYAKQKDHLEVEGECFEMNASFGESDKFVALPLLRQGSIGISFGDYTVDLSGVEAVANSCSIEANCSFGDLTIQVPRRFDVKLTSSTAFGEVDIDGHPAPETDGTIHITANASFGEISIQYI